MSKALTQVWLRETDLTHMITEAKQFAPRETGGVLMGYRDHASVVITAVVASGPHALHGRMSYRPDLIFESNEIARIYEHSGRMHSYLGDWHTHPAGSLRLSGKDKTALRAIARCEDARAQTPIMAILAGAEDDWGLEVWEYTERLIKLIPAALRSTRLSIY